MKNAIRAILALMVLLAFAATACGSAPSGNDAALAPAAISLTWTEDSLDTLTVTWQTTAAAAGQVRFGPRAAGAGAVRTVAAQMQPVHTNQGVRYVHSAVLRGLQPDTDYRYQVAAGAVWSRSYRFTAAGQQAFAFLVFGDSQSVNYAVWRDTLQQARLANPGAAFMTVVGDLVDVGGDYGQWQDWFGAGEGVLESLPVMPLPGNHESYTPERVFSRPQLFTSLFSLPQNGPAGMQEQAYSFDYGDVHFVMLDTQAGEQREFLPDLLQRQTAWLETDLAGSGAKWKIVFMHRPPYDNKSFRDNIAVRQAFTPLFDQYGVDLVFSGHDHVYARSHPLLDGTAAARGPVYIATGRSGSKVYANTAANPLNAVFYNPQDEPNYLTVTVGSDSIRVVAVKQSGAVLDSWTLRKPGA
ncbi:MAG: metallophosphoesterase family protein [Sporomusaceae bacterium]|nr:metallophosphoesterase family protein [Sporomusaceae bacterium]